MTPTGWFLLIVGLVAAALLFWRYGGVDKASRLRSRYLSMNPMPRRFALESLERSISGLRLRYPGRDEVWYLERIIGQFARDRRR